eukprot:2269479-Rhodomonas_salina.1
MQRRSTDTARRRASAEEIIGKAKALMSTRDSYLIAAQCGDRGTDEADIPVPGPASAIGAVQSCTGCVPRGGRCSETKREIKSQRAHVPCSLYQGAECGTAGVLGDCATVVLRVQAMVLHCEIKYKKTQTQYRLYQECVFSYLVSGCRRVRFRTYVGYGAVRSLGGASANEPRYPRRYHPTDTVDCRYHPTPPIPQTAVIILRHRYRRLPLSSCATDTALGRRYQPMPPICKTRC